jgi:hypothetical protein
LIFSHLLFVSRRTAIQYSVPVKNARRQAYQSRRLFPSPTPLSSILHILPIRLYIHHPSSIHPTHPVTTALDRTEISPLLPSLRYLISHFYPQTTRKGKDRRPFFPDPPIHQLSRSDFEKCIVLLYVGQFLRPASASPLGYELITQAQAQAYLGGSHQNSTIHFPLCLIHKANYCPT